MNPGFSAQHAGVVRYTAAAVAEEKIGCGNNCIMQTVMARSNAGDAAIEGYRVMQMVGIHILD